MGGRFFIENPREGGGVSRRGGAEGPGLLNIFFRGRNVHQMNQPRKNFPRYMIFM